MTKAVGSSRIQSIDVLRGLVMVIMALDHVRDYFHLGASTSDPLDPGTTTPVLFFTRFITHYCAPVFIFLAGTSAFLYGRNKSRGTLSRFLWTRGLWLIFVEIAIMSLAWWFNPRYELINLQVIWAIGLCMIFLAGIIYLPRKAILALGLVLVFGHNLLDGITVQGQEPGAILWYILHQWGFVMFGDRMVLFFYPILAWIGVMALGYVFGQLYNGSSPEVRKLWLKRIGLGAILLFVALRALNVYGDLVPWESQERGPLYTFLSFMNVNKYPPSLDFLLITLGPALLFLRAIEPVKNRLTSWLLVFGRVPFFYYVIHVIAIHLAAICGILITGGDWTIMIMGPEVFTQPELWAGYGYPLYVTYLVWIGLVFLLYFPCRWYMRYKARNRDKAWLSYL